PEPDSDLVKVQLAARDPAVAVAWLNLYVTNAVDYLRDVESAQAGALAEKYLKAQVAEMESDIKGIETEFRKLPVGGAVTNRLAQISSQVSAVGTNLNAQARPSMLNFAQQAERLQKALAELDDLQQKYTDLHPRVM